MKTRSFILFAFAALAVAGCDKPKPEPIPNPGPTPGGDECLAIEASVPETGASVVWSVDDRVAVNGQVSEAIKTEEDGVGNTSATFKFSKDLGDGPYSAIYPAGVLGYINGVLDMSKITVKGTQKWTADTFDPAAKYMVGTGSEGAVSFSHACAFIKLTVTGNGTVDKITFTSNGTVPACGKFSVDYENGTIAPADELSESNSSIAIDCAAAPANTSVYYIAIPAQTYEDGYTVKVEDASDNHAENVKNESYTAEAGAVIEITLDFTIQEEEIQYLSVNASVPSTGTTVEWKADDSIAVDGKVSESVEIKDGGVAKFTFAEDLGKESYKAIYPASAVEDNDGVLNMDAVIVKSAQEWVSNSFDPSANYMIGTGTKGAVAFSHACAFIQIPVTGTKTVSKITFKSNGSVPVCGKFSVNYETGALTPAETVSNTNNSIELDCSDALAASPYWIAIPAQTYPDGFTVTIEATDGIYLKHINSTSFAAQAGTVTTLTDSGEQSIVFSEFRINDLEDWKAFVAGVKNEDSAVASAWAGSGAKVVLAKDLDITVADLEGVHMSDASTLYDFAGEFDGCNHKIDRKVSTRMPLFGKVSGTVKNIKLYGAAMTSPGVAWGESGGAATLAAVVDGGTIENCHNYIPINIGTSEQSYATSTICASLVSRIKSGTITGCTNNAAITIYLECNAARKICIGGIVGSACGETACVTISGCENKGAITLNTTEADVNSAVGLGLGCVGGILGQIEMGTATVYATVTGCTNDAAITVGTNLTNTAANLPFACGGIIGMGAKITSAKIADIAADHYYAKVINCTNTNKGNILNEYLAQGNGSVNPLVKIYTGGIAGTLLGMTGTHSEVSGCKNYGSVLPDTKNIYTRTCCGSVVGGILGLGGYVALSGCEVGTVDTPASIGTVDAASFSAAGGIGLAVRTFTMSDCNINAIVNHAQSSVATGAHALGAAFKASSTATSTVTGLSLGGSAVTNCKFNGKIITKTISGSTGVVPEDLNALTSPASATKLYAYPTIYSDTIAATYGTITLSGNGLWTAPAAE